MKIFQFSQQGKRKNNEDNLGENDVLLTVCDGMGGHNFGERASAFVVDQMLQYNTILQPLQKTDIQQQLNQVQTSLNKLLQNEPELEKMGTTFTGVFRSPDFWYAAHIGDSRIYLFRPSEQKLWHTWDHSFVGELMRTHEITMEAGRFHPMSNRISKAIIAQQDNKMATASIVKIDELKKGDILLLCSDGVIEAWGDWELVQLFADDTLGFEQKCEKIAKQCSEKSKDNNTAIIAEIEEADSFSYGSNEELEWTSFDVVKADYYQYLRDSEPDECVEVAQQEETNSAVEEQNDNQIDDSETSEDFDASNDNSNSSRLKYWIIGIILTILFYVFIISLPNQSDNKDSKPNIRKENNLPKNNGERRAIKKAIDSKKDKAEQKTKDENRTGKVKESRKKINVTPFVAPDTIQEDMNEGDINVNEGYAEEETISPTQEELKK